MAGAGSANLVASVKRLVELLEQLTLPLPPEERQRLEAELEHVLQPLVLLNVLVDCSLGANLGARQLAAVLLIRHLPLRLWTNTGPSERAEFLTVTLRALVSIGSAVALNEDVVRMLAETASEAARCVAAGGDGVWHDLFMWLQEVGRQEESSAQINLNRSLQLKAWLIVLTNVLRLKPWQQLLAPHLTEILMLLRHIILNASSRAVANVQQAIRALGIISVSLVRGEEAAHSYYKLGVLSILLNDSVLSCDELCEDALDALAKVASADELLLADAGVYFLPPPNLPPVELCTVVRLALNVAVSHSGARRHLALQLLHNVADSHSQLLVTSVANGKLSAAETVTVLIMSVAFNEAKLHGEAALPLGSSTAEWGVEYAVLNCMSRRLPDRLVLPVVYHVAIRAFTVDGSSALHRAVSLAALRCVLPGCASMVKKQLHRISRLLLRSFGEQVLHSVAFALCTELCSVASGDARCGSARLTERLLPPLLVQLRDLQAHHEMFPLAFTAFETACVNRSRCNPSSKAIAFRLPQVGASAVSWLCDKIHELMSLNQAALAGPSGKFVSDEMLARLCSLLGVLVQKQPLHKALDASGQVLAVRIGQTLLAALKDRESSQGASAALEASGAWMSIAADAGLLSQPCFHHADQITRWRVQEELLHLSVEVAERSLGSRLFGSSRHQTASTLLPNASTCPDRNDVRVLPESALRFFAFLGNSDDLLRRSLDIHKVFQMGIERCAEERDTGLLAAFAELPLRPIIGPEASPERLLGMTWKGFIVLLHEFLQDSSLRRSAAEITAQVQLCESTAPLLLEVSRALLQEERVEVLISLCRAATNFVTQECNFPTSSGRPPWVVQAAECLHRAAEALPQRSVCIALRDASGGGNSDEESSGSDSSDSISSEGATTVASTTDLDVVGAEGELACAVRNLRKAIGLEE